MPWEDAPPEILELAGFTQEFNNESDRGAALVAASLLDERLKGILQAFFLDSNVSNELLNGANAPLGTFSSRISAAYALGLIQKNEFDELNFIRKIRNEFGHKWKDVNFNNAPITDLCRNLPWLGPSDTGEENKPRNRFNFAVIVLLTDLLWRERLVSQEKRTERIWPNRMRS
ncbi:MAG TPA: MltR family transcriptional regulator [Pyrinomonadaceae bacterium]|jgi:hypothetical protein|nr:MltR family transcriptional regulator [Pyrinomonadaceae bacterium]